MKRLTAFVFHFSVVIRNSFYICTRYGECIFYILLGLFLISKFTSISDDMEGCKTLPTADVHYFSGAQHSVSGADGRQCQEKGEDANYNCLADAGCIGNTFSLRHASCSKLLRLNPDFIAAKVARTLKTLLPEEKTTSFPFTFHPHKISYRYYVYTAEAYSYLVLSPPLFREPRDCPSPHAEFFLFFKY